jgi:hypothetical protein
MQAEGAETARSSQPFAPPFYSSLVLQIADIKVL